MMTEADAAKFAREWIEAWNAHDLERILAHYDEGAALVSPAAAKLTGDPSGVVKGIAALRGYFRKGLEAYPNLRFELLEVMSGVASVVICFKNQKGTKTAEFMEFGANGKVARVVANYSA